MILIKRCRNDAKYDIYFFSGLFAYSNQWEQLIRNIPKNFNIYCIELPGHGENKKKVIFEYESYLKLLTREINKISSNRKMFFVGQSLGGLSILALTKFIGINNVEKIILINVATKQIVRDKENFLKLLANNTELIMIKHMKKMFARRQQFEENKGQLMLKPEIYYKLVEYIINNDFSKLSSYCDVKKIYVIMSKKLFGINTKRILHKYGYDKIDKKHCYIINSRDYFMQYFMNKEIELFIKDILMEENNGWLI